MSEQALELSRRYDRMEETLPFVHNENVKKHFPNFQVVAKGRKWIMWQGQLRPAAQTYKVQILYCPAGEIGDVGIHFRPQVWVVSPKLTRRPGAMSIPHLYRQPRSHFLPRLCLYDPADREWTDFKPMGETIIPWTAEWLYCYEVWHMTGDWPTPEAPHSIASRGLEEEQNTEPNKSARNQNKSLSFEAREFQDKPLMSNLMWLLRYQGSIK